MQMMWRRLELIGLLFLILLASCDSPMGVQLVQEDNGVEVTSLVQGNTSFRLSPIDTTGVLPSDELAYEGSFIVNIVQHDTGEGGQVESFARVIVSNRQLPIQAGGLTFGYHGINLGSVHLNGAPMVSRQHTVDVGDSVVAAGTEYAKPTGFAYKATQTYTWEVDSIDDRGISIDAPGPLTVESPVGGSVISTDSDLELRWTCQNNVTVVISMVGPLGKPKPMLSLTPKKSGSAVVPSKVLQLLPPNHLYVFTFIQANRKVVKVEDPFFTGDLLVQAASVYSKVVFLR